MKKNELFPTLILAGGLASRLHPISINIPKSLLPIHGEPFIARQLRLLQHQGVKKVILCLGHLGEQVQAFVGQGEKFNLQVEYIFDGPVLLGTGGAIKQALPLVDENFFVLYGDSYLPCDFARVQNAFKQGMHLALMTVFCNHSAWDTSNVIFYNNKILAYNKKAKDTRMQHIDYGLSIFHKSAFDFVPPQVPYDLATLYKTLLAKELLEGFEVQERFYEVGSFAGIKSLEAYLLNNHRGA